MNERSEFMAGLLRVILFLCIMYAGVMFAFWIDSWK